MLSGLIGEKLTYRIIFIAYLALAIALPFNKVVLSLATLLSVLVVLLDFNLKNYTHLILKNRIILLLFVFLLLHLLSFFWSENHTYFLKDLNSKLPFYVLPLVLVLKPIESKSHCLILFGTFIASVLFFSIYNFTTYFAYTKTLVDDIRLMSQFISHIRFGLMLVFCIALCLFWLNSESLKYKWIPLMLIPWFTFYIYTSEVFSSYLALFGVLMVAGFLKILNSRKRKLGLFVYFIAIGICILSLLFLVYYVQRNNILPKQSELELKTKEGNLYTHDLSTRYFINGHHVYSYICGFELIREWSQVSKYNLLDTNEIGYQHYYILVQYMTSKGLRKDAEGFKKLNEKDIQKIEAGIHNYKEEKYGFLNRITILVNEFSDNDPNGKTVQQRLEFLKTGINIYKKNWLFGVGSGDLQDAFDNQYVEMNSKLKSENRLRAHNQILTYFISFGALGGILFCIFLLISFRFFYQKRLYLAVIFLTVICISFLSEDTLETQMGATFFALFFGFFISKSANLLIESNNEN